MNNYKLKTENVSSRYPMNNYNLKGNFREKFGGKNLKNLKNHFFQKAQNVESHETARPRGMWVLSLTC
jgi:hypothetical protein